MSQTYRIGSLNFTGSVINTTASFEQGDGTQAIGFASHAEGQGSIASGSYSHAEGVSTAYGQYSHAEGSSAAYGQYSHAEGYGASYGEISHAEADSVARGYGTHAEGSSIVGFQNAFSASIVNGVVTMSAQYPDLASSFQNDGFVLDPIQQQLVSEPRMGARLYIYDEEFDNAVGRDLKLISSSMYDGTNTVIYLYDTTVNTATAYIFNTYNTVIGGGSEIIPAGDYSHAKGYGLSLGEIGSAEAEGISFAYGSKAEGRSRTIGESSHADGDGTRAIGDYTHTEGFGSSAVGTYSHAEGASAALGRLSHTEGSATRTYGTASHAEGYGTTAWLDVSHAEGYQANARAYESHAEGYLTSAGKRGYLCSVNQFTNTITIQTQYGNVTSSFLSSNKIVVETGGRGIDTPTFYLTTASLSYNGTNTIITYNESANLGSSFYFAVSPVDFTISDYDAGTYVAVGYDSHAEGIETVTMGVASHAEGGYTKAIGAYSHAEGYETEATSLASHAEGLYTIANGLGQTVVGVGNITSSAQGAFIIGNGNANIIGINSRSNLLFAQGTQVEITGSVDVSGSGRFTNGLTVTGSFEANGIFSIIKETTGTGSVVVPHNAGMDLIALTGFPANPQTGSMFYDPIQNYLYAYNGNGWTRTGFVALPA